MSRDYSKLKVFELANALVLSVYRATKTFPSDERFGLLSQMRRAAVSVPTNIVEGCGRQSPKEFQRFLVIALGSATELRYLVGLSHQLEFLAAVDGPPLLDACDAVVKTLQSFLRTLGEEQ